MNNKKKMNKKIIFITILGFLLLWTTPVFAQADLVVDFEEEPLFNETNFLPGQAVTRCADVTNNSGETQKIGLEIVNNSNCSTDCLSDVLFLDVKENSSIIHTDSLSDFYIAGEQVLSDLGAGGDTIYCFSMTFNPNSGNEYQNTNTNFNINIGFFGEESVSEEVTPGGGSSGGYFFTEGLEIYNEAVSSFGTDWATITWDTNKESTSRVIYSPEGTSHNIEVNNPPDYGYIYSTEEDSNKVINNHSVTVTGLLPGTTYYYRCISHASPDTVSKEHSFTTLTQEQGSEEEGEDSSGEGEVAGEQTYRGQSGQGGVATKSYSQGEVKGAQDIAEELIEEHDFELPEQGVDKNFVATVSKTLFGMHKYTIPFILLLIILIILLLILTRRRREE